VTVTRNGRERIVLLSVAEYQRLKRRDREVMGIADSTGADITAIRKSKTGAEESQFEDDLE
jgi:PHD/YefM family antitoxin component YafN of YafNO toxin-antitoxin module